MSINNDEDPVRQHERRLLKYKNPNLIKSDWTSNSNSSDSDLELRLNSYDMNSNLYGDESDVKAPDQILFPPPLSTLPKFPKEKKKTLVAFGLAFMSFFVNTISIALTHDRVPDRPPLPDIILDTIHVFPQLMKVPDILAMTTILVCFFTILLHHHRWIVARRVFFILSVLYLMRSFTIYATVLPVANYTVYCSPKLNSTSVMTVLMRAGELISGGGMQISGQKKSCGDYIYSGHTVILVTGYLLLKEYLPRKFSILHWISWGISWIGMGMLLLARGHYTIDVLIGYYAATRMFWTYHSLCNNANMKARTENNYYSNVWWFPIFQYLEGNVRARLPHQYSLPWSLQRNRIRHSIFK